MSESTESLPLTHAPRRDRARRPPSAGEEGSAGAREYWARPPAEVADELGADLEQGLSSQEVRRRRDSYGPNVLREAEKRSRWAILLSQFESLVVLLLLSAAVVSAIFGDIYEAVAIGVVVVINTAIGFWMELSATRSMEALRQLTEINATVIREGQADTVPATELVPGDLVVVDAGDRISADARIVRSTKLQVDESVLTGESMPVTKHPDPAPLEASLADRTSALYKGTTVTRGNAQAVVVGTGMNTELGRVSDLVASVEDRKTPLEERLDHLGRRLVVVCLLIAAAFAVISVIQGRPLVLVVETAVALAIATIPEGLPIVATIALARGMWRMARRNALIKNLAAVETLGATSVICADKTGTLTLNQMRVQEVETAEGTVELGDPSALERASDSAMAVLEVTALCNNAEINGGREIGDPMEVALVAAAEAAGIDRRALLERTPELREEAFDTTTKMMATFHRDEGGGLREAVKGAPEAVFAAAARVRDDGGAEAELDEARRRQWETRNHEMARRGLRVIAVAERRWPQGPDPAGLEAYEALTLLGLVGLMDPPRDDAREALEACHRAGIEVVMITGDQPVTAAHIAERVGLIHGDGAHVVQGKEIEARSDDELRATKVFARVAPEQKLDIIALHQKAGHVVAMTGDGVNDAPALRQADIGIAMGKRGTEVAREAADMVLRDDAFSTIVAAVAQGRVIFRNIRDFIYYLLSCNVSELMVLAFAALAFPSLPLPITPLQILYLNLVTDVFPALALGLGEGSEEVMDRAPRDQEEPFLRRRDWVGISAWAALITGSVLTAWFLALKVFDYGDREAVTISFLSLAIAQLLHVFNMRDRAASRISNAVTRNPYVWGAIALCIALLVGPFYVPAMPRLLSLVPLDARGFGIAIAAGFVPMLLGLFLPRRKPSRSAGAAP